MVILKYAFLALVGWLVAKGSIALFRWCGRHLRSSATPLRDVSGLAIEGDGAADLKQESVAVGGPLKPHHRRLALRDARLLPKPRRQRNRWPASKKTRYLSEADADRLFSTTMRSRNRSICDLAPDEAQLARYGLPAWRSEADVAAALFLTPKQLQHLSTHRIRETCPHYVAFAIPKRNGAPRIIYAPKRQLKAVLRRLNTVLIARLPISTHAHGFVSGRSIATNAAPHVGRRVVLKFDIKDCFPSLHFGRVRGLLIALGYSYPVAASLAVLMTEAPRQPVSAEGKTYHVPVGPRVCVQGAPTSPGLCNAILRRLDLRLAGLAAKHGFSFTRYADDLTFSGDDLTKIGDLRSSVAKIVGEEGFSLNGEKTRIMRKGGRQTVAGVVVNDVPGLSRQERRRLRAAIHQLANKPADTAGAEKARLTGRLAYLHMLNPAQAERLAQQLHGPAPV